MKIKAKIISEGKPNITKSQNITRTGEYCHNTNHLGLTLSVRVPSNWTRNLLVLWVNVVN